MQILSIINDMVILVRQHYLNNDNFSLEKGALKTKNVKIFRSKNSEKF